MRRSFLGIIAILLVSLSCGQPGLHPEYKDVDPRASKYVEEYLWLSNYNHIHFDKKVTLGFKKIDQGDTIGLCINGGFFREVDIDQDFWSHATERSKYTLVFHELTHCYCGRAHDYGEGAMYPEKEADRITQAVQWTLNGGPRPGYWDDGCPVSLMYPVLVDDDCVATHYSEYVSEMFNRCDPW